MMWSNKLNFRWSTTVTATVATLIIFLVISVVQYLYMPLDSFILQSSSKKAQLNGTHLETDAYGAVVYRNAPWKAGIGKWMNNYIDLAEDVYIKEPIGGRECENSCSGQGVCNHILGECRCFHGFGGRSCSEKINYECNAPPSAEHPYGHWMVSICSAHCDTTRAMCFCGEGTRYPDRPVAESCGFEISGLAVNWTKADDSIFTNDKSKPGWCNVDPVEGLNEVALYKPQCDCKYDGWWGQFCEIPVECSCVNQCSWNGYCHGGFCQCKKGWFGIDCSIPSVSSSLNEWPLWLQEATLHIPDTSSNQKISELTAVVKKRRPLIYVYDLPPQFDSHLLEGRHFRFECVNRIYSMENATLWTDQLYGSQIALYESLLASQHRTLNAEEADYFYVPVLDACIITRADDTLHLSMRDYLGSRSYLASDLYRRAYDHIKETYPYWNRSAGHDHIWLFSWDEGACSAPKEIWKSTMLVHWGNTNSKHNHSTTAYYPDNWDRVPLDKRGTHPCFDPEKDIVIPAWKKPSPNMSKQRFWARSRKDRSTLFYFNGNLGPAFANNRPEPTYSMGIRQRVAEEYASQPNKDGKLGKQTAKDVIVTSKRSESYYMELGSSIFCGVFPGDGWSGRMEDSILQGCIPVIIQDGIQLPYENMLNYDSFAVRIAEDEIPKMLQILRGINDTEIDWKLTNVQRIWQRFLYIDNVMLEARRQNVSHHPIADWAIQYDLLKGDDVLSTLIQILYYKLLNDPWRLNERRH